VLNQVYPFFPGISADGRWIGFVQYSYNCDPKHYMCSNVKLYDRLRSWESNVTRFYQQSPGLPWSYSDSLALPLETWESQGFAISTDGKIIAMGGNDSKIRIWHITSGIKSFNGNTPEELLEATDIERFSVLAISQNDDWLAAGTTRGIVYIWELQSGRLIYTLKNYNEPIEKILFPEDGAHLIISMRHETWFWSINGSELILDNRISSAPEEVFGLDIAPGGNILATGAADGTVWLQNLPSGRVIGRLGGLSNTVYGLAFSADGTLLAARSVQGVINLWKISENSAGDRSYSLLNSFQSTEYVGELAFSPDGKFLATTGTVGRVTLWSVPDAIQYNLNTQIPNGMVHGVIFPSAGYIMAAVFQNEIVLWELPPKYESVFYTQAEDDTFVDSPPLPSPTANDIPEFDEAKLPSGLLSLDQATAVRHSPLVVPEHLPENLNFLGATVNEDGSAWLRYVTYQQNSTLAMLYIFEKEIGDTPIPTMTIGASAIILPIQFDDGMGQANAEFVQGDWYQINMWTSWGIVPGLDYQANPQFKYMWKWSNLSYSMHLRWQQTGLLIVMYYRVNDSYFPVLSPLNQRNQSDIQRLLLNREDLTQIASGINWYDRSSSELACKQADQPGTGVSSYTAITNSGQVCLPVFTLISHIMFNGNIVTK
jgi:WD40 repeat protein